MTITYKKNKELILEFQKTYPEAKITFKKKAHGVIMYVNGQTAYNTEDVGMYSKELRLNAMKRAFNNGMI